MNRSTIILILASLIFACEKKGSQKAAVEYLGAGGMSFVAKGINPAMNGTPAIEMSMILENDILTMFYDPQANGSFWRAVTLDPAVMGWQHPKLLRAGIRFSYTLKYYDLYYTFGLVNGDIYLWTSNQGDSWALANEAQPVLKHSEDPTSIYNRLWNVGVTVDESGLWHLLVECAPQNTTEIGVGLGYSTASFVANRIDFGPNKTAAHVIKGGGNPWLTHLPTKNALLAVHGVFDEKQGAKAHWLISASTMSLSDNLWQSHLEAFSVSASDVHVADPHLVKLPSGNASKLLMCFSYDQDSMYQAYSDDTFEQLFEKLIQP